MKLDWPRIGDDLDARGWALTGPLLTSDQAAEVADFYADDARFRSRCTGSGRG